MDSVESVVVGAGVVGLAIARALARSGREVVVLEAESAIGTHTSSRNSEVLHAGLYYTPGSIKARSCVRGRHELIAYCEQRGVAFRTLGKMIIATDESQRIALGAIARRATAAGVNDLRWLDRTAARGLEPALTCETALLSPSTGIIDSHALLLALLGDAESHGALLALRSTVETVRVRADGFDLSVRSEAARVDLRCRELVNSAGLGAQALASRIDALQPEFVPALCLAKGNYFALSGRSPFTRLIYPVPDEAGLGVHLTHDLAGSARFGPDVEWVDSVDYRVDAGRADRFYASIREYWPQLPDGALSPAYAGVRPKVVGPGEPAADFRIDGEAIHGVRGLVNLFGIESPGLTACLALATEVQERLDRSR